jgi:hypothetical protein
MVGVSSRSNGSKMGSWLHSTIHTCEYYVGNVAQGGLPAAGLPTAARLHSFKVVLEVGTLALEALETFRSRAVSRTGSEDGGRQWTGEAVNNFQVGMQISTYLSLLSGM